MIRACLAVGSLLAVPVGNSAESASRIIDRTSVCQMPGEGFPDATRFMSVSAQPGPPWISVTNGPSFELRASVRTRAGGRKTTGSVSLSRTECTPTRVRVPLSTSGLREGRAAPGRSYRCDVPSIVLIRVRATFIRPTGFSRDPLSPSVVRARGRVATGYLSVTLPGGRRPLAFASVNDGSGGARLLVAPSRCRAER
jgi:hypothetical protein